MMSYCIYVTFYNSMVDSTADPYMLIKKRQVQPKGPEPASLVCKATEPQQTTPLPPRWQWCSLLRLCGFVYQRRGLRFLRLPQSNFFSALCNIFAIFRPFCDIIAGM